jgi:hypothetical protein
VGRAHLTHPQRVSRVPSRGLLWGAPTSRLLAGGMHAPPARERFARPAHYVFYFFLFFFFLFVFFNYEQFQILNLIFLTLNKFYI